MIKKYKNFDPKQMAMGMKVELEHGSKLGEDTNVTKDDPKKTAMISAAHLKEFPRYYSALEKMESGLKKEKRKIVLKHLKK